MCDDRKLEGVGVVRHVAGIHFGWDSADHFGNPAVYNRDLRLTYLFRLCFTGYFQICIFLKHFGSSLTSIFWCVYYAFCFQKNKQHYQVSTVRHAHLISNQQQLSSALLAAFHLLWLGLQFQCFRFTFSDFYFSPDGPGGASNATRKTS